MRGELLPRTPPLRPPPLRSRRIPTRSRPTVSTLARILHPALARARRAPSPARVGRGWNRTGGGVRGPVPSRGAPSRGDMRKDTDALSWAAWGWGFLGPHPAAFPSSHSRPARIKNERANGCRVSLPAGRRAARRAAPAAPADGTEPGTGRPPRHPHPHAPSSCPRTHGGTQQPPITDPCCVQASRGAGALPMGSAAPSPAHAAAASPESPRAQRGRRSRRRAVGVCRGGRWCFPSPVSFLPLPQLCLPRTVQR